MATNAELDRRLTGLEGAVNTHLLECAKANATSAAEFSAVKTTQNDILKEIKDIKALPGKALARLGWLVIAAAVTVVVETAILHQQAAQRIDVAVGASQKAATAAAATNATVSQLANGGTNGRQ